MVLHGFEDRVDRFLTERVVLLRQGIGLVDEEDASHRFADLLLGLERRLADVAGHETGAVHFDQLSL